MGTKVQRALRESQRLRKNSLDRWRLLTNHRANENLTRKKCWVVLEPKNWHWKKNIAFVN